MKGNPRCLSCGGRGGFMSHRGWVKCNCVKGSKEARALIRRMHSIGATRQGRLFDTDTDRTGEKRESGRSSLFRHGKGNEW